MQDPNPLPWGTQDRYQAHFIVRTKKSTGDDYVARTKITTHGHFGSKKVTDVKWVGGKMADILNEDTQLAQMILRQSVKDTSIWVDPTKSCVRIYGKWKNGYDFGISKELFEIYERIASHVKES
ncbi:MAG: hypothetical protein ACE5JT_00970 [Nitrosopumilaceae archaeon]